MTKEELIEALKEIAANNDDEEVDHARADALLLEYIGDNEVTEAFDSINKWYA